MCCFASQELSKKEQTEWQLGIPFQWESVSLVSWGDVAGTDSDYLNIGSETKKKKENWPSFELKWQAASCYSFFLFYGWLGERDEAGKQECRAEAIQAVVLFTRLSCINSLRFFSPLAKDTSRFSKRFGTTVKSSTFFKKNFWVYVSEANATNTGGPGWVEGKPNRPTGRLYRPTMPWITKGSGGKVARCIYRREHSKRSLTCF